MENLILIVVLTAILGGAAWYVIRAKKSGKKCIGCPDGGNCASNCGCGSCNGCSGCTKADSN